MGAPGLVSGRVVWQRPGRLQAEPARGAAVFVLGTNLAASSDADGRFLVDGLISSDGALLIRFDADGDGQPERQRSFPLQHIGAGRGRQISLGDVSLGQSAAVSGRVLLADVTDVNGHLGTPAFVPGFPLAAITQADGTFLLEGLPEGSVQVAAVRTGYLASLSGPLSLRGGEVLSLARVSLAREGAAPSGVLRGRVVGADGSPLAGVSVSTSGARLITTDATGAWRFSGLPADRYDVVFRQPGRLPAALYNVLVAGADEAVAPDVVLIEGQPAATTPSLVDEVTGERDGGSDGGTGSTDGGFVARILFPGAAPLTLVFPGPSVGLNAEVVPAPVGAVAWAWRLRGDAGVVMLGNPTAQQTGLQPLALGSFILDLEVSLDGQRIAAAPVTGSVVAASVDAGPLRVTDAGVTALSMWFESEGPMQLPITGTVMAGATAVPALFSYNQVNGRLVAVFDSPQPGTSLDLQLPDLRLVDGGVRRLSYRAATPPLSFGPSTLLLDGGLADFTAGVTYTPFGAVAVGRLDDGSCASCFIALSPQGQETLGGTSSAPAVSWRRASAAGFTVQAWFSPSSSYQRVAMTTSWAPAATPPGPVYADGPQLKSVGAMGSGLELWTLVSGTWSSPESFGNFAGGLSLRRSSVTMLPNGTATALVIADDGTVQFSTKSPAGFWQSPGWLLPALPFTVTGGRIAGTSAGLVMFLTDTMGATLWRLPTGQTTWVPVSLGSRPFDLVGRGATAYLVSSSPAAEQLEVTAIDPATGALAAVGALVSAPVRSAELAVGDFGELAVAWSEQTGGTFNLRMSEIK